MLKHLRNTAAALVTLSAAPAMADCVAASHVVQPGETVFTIAEGYYGQLEQWSLIFYSNPGQLSNPLEIPAGTALTVPCPTDGSGFVADATPLQVEDAEMRLVTGSNYAPFTDRSWPGQGMITELVNAAMEETPNPVTYSIDWDDDWTVHLPSLDAKAYDMGFPWFKPDCEQMPDHERCSFHFSEPIVELLQLLFVVNGSGLTFEEDGDIHGKTLCRPAGYFTFDLDSADRLWLTNGLVELEQPATPADCFNLLVQGEVDAVALNEFTGWTTLSDMGLRNAIAPLPNPLGVQGLHVIISKQHWRGTTHLYRINAGLAKLKESDRYDEIVSRHLGVFWNRVN
ncbi:MAG: transporter substrate-binding domain-containing protein [Pseudomonadota bacterium]